MITIKDPQPLEALKGKTSPMLPHAKRYWQAVSHYDLLMALVEQIKSRRWEIQTAPYGLVKDPIYSVSHDGNEMVGSIDVRPPTSHAPEGMVFSLGISNSNSQDASIKLYGGFRVTVGNLGLPLIEVPVGKHTSGFDPQVHLDKALTVFSRNSFQFSSAIKELELWPLPLIEAERYLMKASRKKWIPWSRMGRADKLYREGGNSSALGLLLAFATLVKMNPPLKQMGQILKFYKLLKEPTIALTER